MYSLDGRIALLRSTDGGATWAQEHLVWDAKDDDRPYSYGSPRGMRLSDGTLVVSAHRWTPTGVEDRMFNADTGGSARGQAVLFRSSDGGSTWSPPEIPDIPDDGLGDLCAGILELPDGRWFMPCEVWKAWDDPSPLHIKGFAVFSDDRGKTWGGRVDLPGAKETDRMYSHTRYTRMLDGRIAGLQWTQDVGATRNFDLRLIVSDTTGTRWDTLQPTGLMGQTSGLADVGDGLLAAIYTSRDSMNPGMNVVLSADGGETWDVDNQVMVWDAVGQEYLGVVHKPQYPASHDNIAFGTPGVARLPDGRLIVSWWCTQACVTHIRFALLTVE
jgi:hypothetical protein